MSLNSEMPVSRSLRRRMLRAAQPGNRLLAWDADRRVGVANAGPVAGDRLEFHVREANEQLVEVLALSVRVQLKARPKKGESFVAVSCSRAVLVLALRLVTLVREAPEYAIVLRKVRVHFRVALVRALLSDDWSTRLFESPGRFGSG